MSTTFEAELPLTKIHEHPKNPRHSAVADDEMVASIRESGILEPVIVAPHPTKAGQYILIAGHRRRDGAKKAKRKDVPAVVRADLVTEGQQVEAMIIENGHRKDLSPIEEAEGYAQLELLGYKQAQIAAAVGRNVKTIRSRLGLLKLSKSTKEKVHDGQLNLEDAIAIGEFADDPATTKKLEKAAESGQLRYELASAKQRREAQRLVADKVAQLVDAGATPYTLPKGKDMWQLRSEGVLETIYSHADDNAWAEHKGHLGYLEHSRGGIPSCDVLCLDPSSHASKPAAKSKEEREREAERKRRDEEYAAERAADAAARAARTSTLLDLVGTGTKLTPQLRDLIKALLPHLILTNEYTGALDGYLDATDVPEADRWENTWWNPDADKYRTLALQNVAELETYSDGKLARGLVGALLGAAEANLDAGNMNDSIDQTLISSYYALLGEAGYVNAPPDEAIQEKLREAWAAAEDDDEEKAS